jgi:hypothetical protein
MVSGSPHRRAVEDARQPALQPQADAAMPLPKVDLRECPRAADVRESPPGVVVVEREDPHSHQRTQQKPRFGQRTPQRMARQLTVYPRAFPRL